VAKIPPEMGLFSSKTVTLDLFEDSNDQQSPNMIRLSPTLAVLSARFVTNPAPIDQHQSTRFQANRPDQSRKGLIDSGTVLVKTGQLAPIVHMEVLAGGCRVYDHPQIPRPD
jgi:hypothetical protein